MARVIALVPARAGSKGVRDKNVRLLGGHSLLEWSIAASRKAATVERVLVSTDSAEYANMAGRFGGEAPFLRPPEISGDRAADYDFVIHALDWLSRNGGEPDYVVHIRPTTPFRDPRLIDEAVRAFAAAPKATAMRSVHEMSESAYKTFEIADGGRLKRVGSDSTALDGANTARQTYPSTYYPNGYVDVLSTSFIRSSGLLHGDHVLPYVTPAVVEVDTEEDLAHLEFQLSRSPGIARQVFG